MAEPSSSPGLFARSDRYMELREIALTSKPEGIFEDGVFLVAVLRQEKDASTAVGGDFVWFKVKPKHSVAKLRQAYGSRTGVEVDFKFDGFPIEAHKQMRQLSLENIVVFTSYTDNMGYGSASSSFSSTRTPLGPSNSQLHNIAAPIVDDKALKPEETNLSVHQSAHGLSPSPAAAVSGPQVASSVRTPTTPSRQAQVKRENAEASSSVNGFARYAGNASPFGVVSTRHPAIKPESFSSHRMAKNEPDVEDALMADAESSADVSNSSSQHDRDRTRLQDLIATGSPEELEAEVQRSLTFLDSLKKPLAEDHKDAQYFTQQIATLRNHEINTPTIIGVVGNTGAGKSSVINAMLDEERLVPTNCMRACTAVVTEMSWNPSDDENSRYRAEIEFIKASDWEKDLRLSFSELLDASGKVCSDLSADSEAGIAWAKIKCVYPNKTKDDIANSTVEQLMKVGEVKAVLGTTTKITKRIPANFYKALQAIIDSKEKATGDAKKKREKAEKRTMEFWPLIKVVRIYTKAEALATGAVIVDLPGVHDSNPARAAVAAGYLKQCTGLWIVAPINRAVDDKAAKTLLGESFKRQLKYDGTYSRITFICSKTDDISITEASESLGYTEQFEEDWAEIEKIEEEQRTLKRSLGDLKESRSVYADIINEADDSIEVYEKLKDDVEGGKTVCAPSDKSKKRRRSTELKSSRKKPKTSKGSNSDDDDDDDFIDDDDEDEEEDVDANDSGDSDSESMREALTLEAVEEKLAELKENKRRARKERVDIAGKVTSTAKEVKSLEEKKSKIEAKMRRVCIEGRNSYSKEAIQQDFAAGIKELDMENAQEDEDFNPDDMDNMRDYDEVARSLPVFCVSSRAAQKLSGRLVKESDILGFQDLDSTEVPALRRHCTLLTEAGRASNCRRFLNNLSQLLTSITLWTSNDGTGLNMSEGQLKAEAKFLKDRLTTLEKTLDKGIQVCLESMNQSLAENIFENYEHVVQLAIEEAGPRVQLWHSPINRDQRELGGYHWGTYRAIMRRDGVYANSWGPHDFNAALAEPIFKHLANNWERVFAQRLPRILQNFSRQGKLDLSTFHGDIEARSTKQGTGVAGVAMLGNQLKNYEAIFEELANQMKDLINAMQRDANREFTPKIAESLAVAYDAAARENGTGSFHRMKSHIEQHVNSNQQTMFEASCDEVKKRLLTMVRDVKMVMTDKVDDVFVCMNRDYMEIIAGKKPTGQTMPKWERQMRAAVRQAIEDREERNLEGYEAEERRDTENAEQKAGSPDDAGLESPAEDSG